MKRWSQFVISSELRKFSVITVQNQITLFVIIVNSIFTWTILDGAQCCIVSNVIWNAYMAILKFTAHGSLGSFYSSVIRVNVKQSFSLISNLFVELHSLKIIQRKIMFLPKHSHFNWKSNDSNLIGEKFDSVKNK